MEYLVDLGTNIWKKKWKKNTHSGPFRGSSPGTGSAQFSVSTSFRILVITFSFIIRFE